MTFIEAYIRLEAAWPHDTFSLDISGWHYKHLPQDSPVLVYSVWNERLHKHFTGPTLEAAMGLALAGPVGLALVERQLADVLSEAP